MTDAQRGDFERPVSAEPTAAEESTDLTPGVVWTDSQLAVVRQLVARAHKAESKVAAAREEGRQEVRAAVIQPLEELFAGGPDTACRTTWQHYPSGPLSMGSIECVEVPMADLRAAFDRARAAVAPAQPADGEGEDCGYLAHTIGTCGCRTHAADRCAELGCDCTAQDFAAYDPGQFDYGAEESR